VLRSPRLPSQYAGDDLFGQFSRRQSQRLNYDRSQFLVAEFHTRWAQGLGHAVGVNDKNISTLQLHSSLRIRSVKESADDGPAHGQTADHWCLYYGHGQGGTRSQRPIRQNSGSSWYIKKICGFSQRSKSTTHEHWRIVPGVDICQSTRPFIKLRQKKCCVTPVAGRSLKQAIHRRNDIG